MSRTVALLAGLTLLVPAATVAADSVPATIRLGRYSIGGAAWFNVDQPLRTYDLARRPVLVVYWATWCPHCLRNVPLINTLEHMYADRGLVIIAVTQEPATVVASYVKAYQIRYPVCAGAPARYCEGIPSVPHFLLFSATHTLLRQGSPQDVVRALHVLMKTHEYNVTHALTRPGTTSTRPVGCSWAPGRGPGNLAKAVGTITDSIRHRIALDASALKRVYDFYWLSLPANGQPGDSELRSMANTALLTMFAAARDVQDTKALDSIRAEVLKRLQSPSPLWSDRAAMARYTTYVFPEGNASALRALRAELRKEKNPLVRYYLTVALETLDPSVPRQEDPPSEITRYQQRYRTARASWLARLNGMPPEWSDYDRFVSNIVMPAYNASRYDPNLLRKLERLYYQHQGETPADVLFRYDLLQLLGSIIGRFGERLPEAERRPIGTFVLSLLSGEPDIHWELRQSALFAVRAELFDASARKQAVAYLKRWLRKEDVRIVRASMQAAILELEHPNPGG